jgi:hypothetical protein
MFLLKWYKEWLEIRASFKEEAKVCESCETLKQQLEIANHEKDKLLARIMEKPEPTPERTVAPEMLTRPRMIPWAARRQMLESEDRAKAKAIKEAAQPDKKKEEAASIAEFEKEMDNAAAERERSAKSSN